MNKLTNQEMAIKLLNIVNDLDQTDKILEKTKQELIDKSKIYGNFDISFEPYPILGVALDLLGVPSQNVDDLDQNTGLFIANVGEPYSREFIEQKWFDLKLGSKTADDIKEFINWVDEQVSRYSNES